MIGRPAGVQIRCRRRPQNRQWLGQVGEGAGQVPGQEPPPACFGADTEQDLGHGEGEQFGIGQPWRSSGPGGLAEVVIDLDLECGQKVFRNTART